MESHTSRYRRRGTLVLALAIGLVVTTTGLAESQLAELEPGPYSYQHAQLMADLQATSFGQRTPPAENRMNRQDAEIEDLCRHLDSLQEQIRQTEQRLHDLSEAVGPPERMAEPPMRPRPVGEVGATVDELNDQRNRLAEQANQQTAELRELRTHVMNRQREILAELHEIHEQMLHIEEQLVGLDRRRQEHLERLLEAQNRLQELEARLHDLMAEVNGMQNHVAERIGENDRQAETIHGAIEQTRQEAQHVRDQIEEIQRAPVEIPAPPMRPRQTFAPPRRPMPAPPAAVPDPALQVEIKRLRDEVVQLRQQLCETPRRVEIVYVDNPYGVGSARGYHWPSSCR